MTAERFPRPDRLRGVPVARALTAAGSVLWGAFVLAVCLAPDGSAGRSALTVGASWMAQASAVAALIFAASRARGAKRLPWTLFCLGVAARLGADVVWVGARAFGAGPMTAFQVAAHAVSYALLFAVLLWLMSTLRREMVSVAALDTLSVMLTTGLLVWYFALGSGAWLGDGTGDTLARLVRPVCDLGLLFLGLAAFLSVRRPPFVVLMTGGLLALLAADVAYLWSRAQGVYELGLAEALWSGGVMFLAFAALVWGGERVRPAEHVGPVGVALFWFGPLSPLLQYGFLLLWGALRPAPLPPYALVSGAVLAVVLASRMYEITRALRRQASRETALARQAEGGRILRELHDTVKQGVHGTSLMIEAAILAEKTGDGHAVRDLLGKALETSRETGYELSKPLDEVRLLSGHAGDPEAFFGERLRLFGERFGMETHANLGAPLSELSREQLSVAHRVFAEAAWNAAKHSGASNLRLETRREGDEFVLRLRDDGRGFDPGAVETGGYGLRSMRSRAGEVGAKLRVASRPGEGTVVELRFGR